MAARARTTARTSACAHSSTRVPLRPGRGRTRVREPVLPPRVRPSESVTAAPCACGSCDSLLPLPLPPHRLRSEPGPAPPPARTDADVLGPVAIPFAAAERQTWKPPADLGRAGGRVGPGIQTFIETGTRILGPTGCVPTAQRGHRLGSPPPPIGTMAIYSLQPRAAGRDDSGVRVRPRCFPYLVSKICPAGPTGGGF